MIMKITLIYKITVVHLVHTTFSVLRFVYFPGQFIQNFEFYLKSEVKLTFLGEQKIKVIM